MVVEQLDVVNVTLCNTEKSDHFFLNIVKEVQGHLSSHFCNSLRDDGKITNNIHKRLYLDGSAQTAFFCPAEPVTGAVLLGILNLSLSYSCRNNATAADGILALNSSTSNTNVHLLFIVLSMYLMFQVLTLFFFCPREAKQKTNTIYDCNRNKIVNRGWVTGTYCM